MGVELNIDISMIEWSKRWARTEHRWAHRVKKFGRQMVSIGDVFSIPLRSKGYGFGRIIYIAGKWKLAEFFADFREKSEYSNGIIKSGRVMPVYNIVTLAIEKGDWPIVARDEEFEPSDLADLVFYKGLPESRCYITALGQPVVGDSKRAVGDATSAMPQFAEFISERLWEALQARSLIRGDS